jgi:hypothetical protein
MEGEGSRGRSLILGCSYHPPGTSWEEGDLETFHLPHFSLHHPLSTEGLLGGLSGHHPHLKPPGNLDALKSISSTCPPAGPGK